MKDDETGTTPSGAFESVTESEGMAPPPEGVIAGESVPRENELSDREEALIQELVGKMKGRGEPFASMSDNELRERAVNKLQEKGVIR